MTPRFLAIILAVPTLTLVTGCLWATRARRVLQLARSPSWLQQVPAAFVTTVVSSLILLILTGIPDFPRLPSSIERIAGILGLIGGLILLATLVPSLIASGLAALERIRSDHKVSNVRSVPSSHPLAPAVSRRQIISAGIWNAPTLLGLGSALVANRQLEDFRVSKIDLTTDNTPLPSGLKILHISDLHVGRFTRGKILERIVESSSSLRPDLIAFTGDLINHKLDDLPAGIDLLLGLQRIAPTYACEGNHDLFQSRRVFRDSLAKAGIPLLLDESHKVAIKSRFLRICGATWSGVDGDTHLDRTQMEANLAQRIPSIFSRDSNDVPTILLAHHPHAADHAPGAHLTLAGHTHGGQLMLTQNRGPGPALYRYWSGLHTSRELDRPVIVSNGVGNWFPLRTAAPAEITLINLG